MDFFSVVAARRSVRKYTKKEVPEQVIRKAIDAALLAPNSSNMQPWQFYWVKSPQKKAALVEACLSQSAASTAQELIVAVARLDTWREHRDLLLADRKNRGEMRESIKNYYEKVVPLFYRQDPFGILALFKKIVFTVTGLFRPVPRGPVTRSELLEVVSKTTALACENLMLALTAQGYGSCPMEGFDENRVKKILGLNGQAHVVMVISAGETDPSGIWGSQYRVPTSNVVFEV